MDFPTNYHLYLTDSAIKYHFPNLRKGDNFKLTSLNTDHYNCISWAFEITNHRTQLYDHLGNGIVDADEYIHLFNKNGFYETQNSLFEEDKIKIAVYLKVDSFNNEFKHVARLLKSGKWTSKLGDWEDIEHETPEDLIGTSYGNKVIIMEKKTNISFFLHYNNSAYFAISFQPISRQIPNLALILFDPPNLAKPLQ